MAKTSWLQQWGRQWPWHFLHSLNSSVPTSLFIRLFSQRISTTLSYHIFVHLYLSKLRHRWFATGHMEIMTPAISVHSLNFILQWFPSLKKTSRKHRQKQHIHIATQNNHVIPRIFSILLTTSHNIFLETILALHYQKVKFYFIVRQLTIRVSQLLGSSQEFTVKSLILRSEARKQLGVARICFLL